jgi:hypothetical protein
MGLCDFSLMVYRRGGVAEGANLKNLGPYGVNDYEYEKEKRK